MGLASLGCLAAVEIVTVTASGAGRAAGGPPGDLFVSI